MPHHFRGSHQAQRTWEPSLKPRGESPFLGVLENNEAPSVSVEAQPDLTRAAVLQALKVTAVATVNSTCVDRSRAAPEAGAAGRTWEGQSGFSQLEPKRPEQANTHQGPVTHASPESCPSTERAPPLCLRDCDLLRPLGTVSPGLMPARPEPLHQAGIKPPTSQPAPQFVRDQNVTIKCADLLGLL